MDSEVVCFTLVLSLLGQPWLARASEWEIQQEGEITIHTRYIPNQPLKKFKVTSELDASLASVLDVIHSVEGLDQWFYGCQKARLLQHDREKGVYYSYIQFNAPWPVSDRDAVVRSVINQDTETLEVIIEGKAVADRIPEKDGFVRVPSLKSEWHLKPLGPEKTWVELIGHGEPGGSIPTWIANLVAPDMPYYSMRNLKTLVESPEQGDK